MASKSGQCAKKIKVYKYSDQLSFLNKYFDEREMIGNINSQKDELENQDNDTQHHEEEEEEKETHEEDLASQSSPSPKCKNISESVEIAYCPPVSLHTPCCTDYCSFPCC